MYPLNYLLLLQTDHLIYMICVIVPQMHDLAMKLALQKSQNAELRNQFEGNMRVQVSKEELKFPP